MATCLKCGKEFKKEGTPEELLLDAIFGNNLICPECSNPVPICIYCGKEVSDPIFFEDKPYHSRCLSEIL